MKFIPQLDQMDCGPACLAMIANKYGKNYDVSYLREITSLTREGIAFSNIIHGAKEIGFETLAVKLTPKKLKELILDKKDEAPLPCILHWNQNHFLVLYKIKRTFWSIVKGEDKIYYKIADPGYGFITLSQEKFETSWVSEKGHGLVMFLEPTKKFHNLIPLKKKSISLKYLYDYLPQHKQKMGLMFLFLLIGSALNLILPFLTQGLIDKGIKNKDFNYITYILFAQVSVFLGIIIVEIFRNWITLYVGTKLSIEIISNFLKKLLSLPITFFYSKMDGDIQQRIQDNERIENFITSQSILTVFSIIIFSTFLGVLWYYDYKIMITYLLLTTLSVIWSIFWLRKKKKISYYKFQQQSKNQNSIWEMINGVTEMKINLFEDYKRNEWEKIQQKLFDINIRILKIDQIQQLGFELINQLKNIFITFFSAFLVINEKMTLGELLSVSYIVGQMNSPVNQLVTFFRSLQDAKISLERLNEVQLNTEEELPNQISLQLSASESIENLDNSCKETWTGICFQNVFFQYNTSRTNYVLNDINLKIPEGKTTAIVGASGSGKTTLIKLLLKFYEPSKGKITLTTKNNTSFPFNNISPKSFRKLCGVVMQDGYIFSESIERNIACGDQLIDHIKMNQALKIANIESFIQSLPLGLKTRIGTSGNGISGGQRQRILIARAVYKNPQYIFFDEATSSLDSENEKIIHDNLQGFFKDKTVVIIAHRLSTVKNADKIIVLKNGIIVEEGNHNQLVYKKAYYYNLVKNQLELAI
jgi:ATP-binding cassette subfamily B protein